MAKTTSKKDETPLNLTQKLCQVMATVDRIPKTGRNDYHGYSYAEEAVIVEAIRKELASRNVMLYPSLQTRMLGDGTGAITVEGGITTVLMTYTFVDGDSGETMESAWAGQGQDSGDKGLYKAYTGSNKYYLMKTFLLPTGDEKGADDPENPAKEALPTPAFAKAPSKATPKATTKATPKAVPVATEGECTVVGIKWKKEDLALRNPESDGGSNPLVVTFSDGKTASVFEKGKKEMVAIRAKEALEQGYTVIYNLTRDGRWFNLDELDFVNVPADTPYENKDIMEFEGDETR
jgi:hypothetical protein